MMQPFAPSHCPCGLPWAECPLAGSRAGYDFDCRAFRAKTIADANLIVEDMNADLTAQYLREQIVRDMNARLSADLAHAMIFGTGPTAVAGPPSPAPGRIDCPEAKDAVRQPDGSWSVP